MKRDSSSAGRNPILLADTHTPIDDPEERALFLPAAAAAASAHLNHDRNPNQEPPTTPHAHNHSDSSNERFRPYFQKLHYPTKYGASPIGASKRARRRAPLPPLRSRLRDSAPGTPPPVPLGIPMRTSPSRSDEFEHRNVQWPPAASAT
ncbi:hypothetical protein FPV67DRAFT_1677735 [Lyophyllum atratum]|nr:hypothetical protein FPV67DRAFT_1677735 [Lyophyllum atratum]